MNYDNLFFVFMSRFKWFTLSCSTTNATMRGKYPIAGLLELKYFYGKFLFYVKKYYRAYKKLQYFHR